MMLFFVLRARRHLVCFFFNDTATTEIYTLSLHDALPISLRPRTCHRWLVRRDCAGRGVRSEEHTSELQSHSDLVCRLLLEKKKQQVVDNAIQVQDGAGVTTDTPLAEL